MTTYTNGITDYIPALQPFNPDLNFYAGVLSTKQQQYDQGLSKLNSIYSSALNSPMLRQDNIERRDQYFKTITQDVQKIAGLDLSVDQNVETAKRLFDPILNDKNIVNDMVFTRKLSDSYNTAEQYRNCIDPDKCGGEFWNEGVQALDYAAEEFKNASPDDALRHSAPKFVPKINVTKKAIKAAKDAGFNVSYDHNEGRYMVTDTNGQILLGQNGDGVLPQFLLGMFGNDASIQDMYSTQAYVQRKNYAKQNAGKFGGDENAAESDYLHQVISQTVPKLEKSKRDLTDLRDQMNTDSKSLEILAKNNGGVLPGDGIMEAYDKLQNLISNTASAEQYHENVSNLINTAPNINDLKQLRTRADNIAANGLFMNTIQAAAFDYAMGTSKRDIKADPYALAQFNNNLDISKGVALQNHEFAIWQEKEKIKGLGESGKLGAKLGIGEGTQGIDQYLKSKGITPEKLAKEGLPQNVKDWTDADFRKVREGGLGQDVAGKINEIRTGVNADIVEDGYTENSKLIIKSVENLKASAGNYLKESFDAMRSQYLTPSGTSQEEKNAVRNKILNNMTSILAGTGISPEDLIAGTTPTDIFTKEPIRFSKSIARATSLQEKDIASQVITNQWSPKALAKYQVDKQVAEGFYARRKAENQTVIGKLRVDKVPKINFGMDVSLDPEKAASEIDQVTKSEALINAIADENGLVTKDQAFNRYLKATQGVYKNDPDRIEFIDKNERLLIKGKTAVQKAKEDFDKNIGDIQQSYRDLTSNWKAKAGSSDRGGALAAGKEMEFSVRGEQRFSPAYNQVEKIANEIPDLNNIIVDKGLPSAANKFFETVKLGDTKGVDFNYTMSNQPARVSKEGPVPASTLMNVTLTDDAVRKVFDLKKDDDVTPYKTFSVKLPVGTSSTADQFLNVTTPNNVDIYMLQDKATLNQTLPNLGSYNITRQGKDFIFNGNFYGINPLTKEMELMSFDEINLTGESGSEISPEDAIKIGNDLLAFKGRQTAARKKELLESQSNAGSKR